MRDSFERAISIAIVFAILAVMLGGPFYLMGYVNVATTDDATAQGHVVDLTTDYGLLWKTDSVELMPGDDADSTEVFCIPEGADAERQALRRAIQNHHRVTIEYSEPHHAPPWECPGGVGGPQVVTDVTVHGPNAGLIGDPKEKNGGDA